MALVADVIMNAGSGSVSDEQVDELRHLFSEGGAEARIHLVHNGEDISAAAEKVASGDADVVVAAGGDGTISTVAGALVGSSKPLSVIPLGTLNNFSKDLNIPTDLPAAVAAIINGKRQSIDIASVNGRYFVNNSSIGLYPRIVRHREKQQNLGRGKWWAAAWASIRMMRISPFLKVRLTLEDEELARKTLFVFIGNNPYEMDLYNIGRRPSLDKGVLSIYLLRGSGRMGVVAMILRTLVGSLKQMKNFEELQTGELTIDMRRKNVLVATDGEVSVMQSPLNYKIHPRALEVIVPAES